MTEKNQKRALDLYYDLLTLREPPMRILFLLAKQFRQICLTKKLSEEGLSQTEIASKLGVPSFVVRNLESCARAYTVEELENAVRDFVDAGRSCEDRYVRGCAQRGTSDCEIQFGAEEERIGKNREISA